MTTLTKPTNIKNLHDIVCIFFLPCALSGYIFVNPFISCVTDRYQYKQCIIMETETENLHVLRFYWLCVQLVTIFSLINVQNRFALSGLLGNAYIKL